MRAEFAHEAQKSIDKQQCHLHTVQDQISWNQYQFNDVDEKQSILSLYLGVSGVKARHRNILHAWRYDHIYSIKYTKHHQNNEEWEILTALTHSQTHWHMQQCVVVELMK